MASDKKMTSGQDTARSSAAPDIPPPSAATDGLPHRPGLSLELWYKIAFYAVQAEGAIPANLLAAEHARLLQPFKQSPQLLKEAERCFWKRNEISDVIIVQYYNQFLTRATTPALKQKIQHAQVTFTLWQGASIYLLENLARDYPYFKTLTVTLRVNEDISGGLDKISRFVHAIREIEMPEVLLAKTNEKAGLPATSFQLLPEKTDVALESGSVRTLSSGSSDMEIAAYFEQMPPGFGLTIRRI